MDSAAQPAEMASQPQPPSPPGQESDAPRPADRSDQDLNTMNAGLDRGSTPHNNPAMESSTSPLAEQEEGPGDDQAPHGLIIPEPAQDSAA